MIGVNVQISHEPAANSGTPAKDAIEIVEEGEGEPDTVTTIELWSAEGQVATVRLHWRTVITLERIGLHFDDEAQTLFVGAHTVAAAVRIRERKVVDQHQVLLFWSFEIAGDYVVELGELYVFLRGRTGEIIASAPVDPPYDITRTPEGIRLDSPTVGTQWLRFPE